MINWVKIGGITPPPPKLKSMYLVYRCPFFFRSFLVHWALELMPFTHTPMSLTKLLKNKNKNIATRIVSRYDFPKTSKSWSRSKIERNLGHVSSFDSSTMLVNALNR